LHCAAVYGRNAFGAELLARGIDCNLQDPDGATPLHYAAVYKNEALAKAILLAGGRLDIADKHGNQPLWTAAFNARGNYGVVALFMRHGADATHTNNVGKSPLDIAKAFKDDALLGLLAKAS
jgi:uncharacterized protein